MRNDIKEILGRANFFSGLMDGSKARKTGSEKELVYDKVVVNGSPTEILLKCQHMADFGGEDARSVKKAFDNAFITECGLPREKFQQSLISVCTDGASVNLGRYKGACTQLKEEREWLLIIHCSNHRLELAIKDAFKTNTAFLEIDDTITQIYYLFRKSGKAKRILTELALLLDVTKVSFVKASGTRFQNHKYRAIKAMTINYLPLCLYMENMVESPHDHKAETIAKSKGYLNKFQTYKYLAALHLYRLVLQQTAHLSFVMQTPAVLITDIIDSIAEANRKLTEITESEVNLPFTPTAETDNSVTIDAKATNLPATLAFKEKHTLSSKQKRKIDKYTTVQTQKYELKRVSEGKRAVEGIKESLIPAIKEKIEERFEPFLSEDEIYHSISFVDHTRWDITDKDGEITKIKNLSRHFDVPLKKHSFSVDRAIYEFRQLRTLIHEKYRHFKSKIYLWRMIYSHHAEKFPHILLLVELCLTIAVSSATVERGFSTTGRILNDSRLSMNKQTLNDLLLIRVNITALRQLDPNYDEKLVNKAIDLYLQGTSRGRYHKTKNSKSAETSRVPDPSGILSPDTFLPTPFTAAAASNPLLDDEPFAACDSDSESDSEADSDESDSSESYDEH